MEGTEANFNYEEKEGGGYLCNFKYEGVGNSPII